MAAQVKNSAARHNHIPASNTSMNTINFINTRGNIAIQLLVLLVTVAVTSGIILWLVQSGIVTVNSESDDVSVLNAEFIPIGREGTVVIEEFQWCRDVDEQYNCQEEISHFQLGEEVHFRFIVETSTVGGYSMLIENYRLKDPAGNIILDVDQRNDYGFEVNNPKKKETVAFRDYFIVYPGSPSGAYTLELIIENPLLNKKITITQKVLLMEP